MLTDGGDTQLETLSGADRERSLNTILSRIKEAEALNLRLFTIGVGSPQGAVIPDITYQGEPVRSSLDEDLLRRLAQAGRGRYYFANDSSVLAISQDIVRLINQDDPYVEVEESEIELTGTLERMRERDIDSELIYRLYFQYPLFLAIALLTVGLLLPESIERRQDV